MRIWDTINEKTKAAVEELQLAADANPDVRSIDHRVATMRRQGFDKHKPDKKKLERYWDLYENVPIIREPIRAFAGEVVEPGYYVEAGSEEAEEDLEKWLSECCIVEGEVGKNFRELLKKATVQREVKGTAFIEKVYQEEDGENLYGFKLMPTETMRAYTKPGQSVLRDPDDNPSMYDNYHKTDDGKIAAYVQFDSQLSGYQDQDEIPFARDDVIKLTRDADVGKIFGESRLTAVEDRIESLLKKLEDNDKAIESLAHPFQLIQFGDGEDIWEPEEIEAFMSQHDSSDFEPGMKQGVQGNVDITTVTGEVAEINEYLQFDVNWIVSEMPLPKYALGGFEEDVNQFVSRSQESRVEKQVNDSQKEIEDEWTPVLKQKAEELGYNPEEVQLHVSENPEDLGLDKAQEIVEKAQENGDLNEGESGTDFTRPPASTEESRQENEESGNKED